jgi:hypothetical protein
MKIQCRNKIDWKDQGKKEGESKVIKGIKESKKEMLRAILVTGIKL